MTKKPFNCLLSEEMILVLNIGPSYGLSEYCEYFYIWRVK